MGRLRSSAWRATQPAQPVGVNWSNPLARGLVFAAIPTGGTFYDCVTGTFGVNTGTITPGIRSRNGGKSQSDSIRTLIAGSASSNYVQWPVSVLRGGNMTTDGTLLALASAETQVDGNLYTVCGNTDGAVSGEGFGLAIDSYAYADRGDLIKTNYTAGGVLGASAGAAIGNPFNNQLHLFGYAFTGNGASGDWLYGGNNEAFTGASTHGTTTTDRRACIFAVNGATGRHDMAVGLVLFWNRRLSVAEYRSLYANPWQLFQQRSAPQRSAGGAADATVSGQTLTLTASLIAGTVAADASVASQTLTTTASLIAGSATGESNATVGGQTLTVTASLLAGTASGDAGATVNGQTLTTTASLIAGTVAADSSVAGQVLTTTASLIAGSATGESNATVSGQTLTTTASLIAGAVSNDTSVAGQTLTLTASLIAGTASGTGDATVNGQVLTATAVLLAGSVGNDYTVSGQTLTATASLIAGAAFGPGAAGTPGESRVSISIGVHN